MNSERRGQDKRKLSDWLERPVTLSKPNTGETRNIEIEWDDGTAEILKTQMSLIFQRQGGSLTPVQV